MTHFSNPKSKTEERVEPVDRMIAMIRQSGVVSFENPGHWESCLSALVLAMEPKCRVYRFLEALPANRESMTETDVLDTLARLGYFSRCANLRLNEMDSRIFPCLFVQDDGIPLVLIERDRELLKTFKDGTLIYLREKQLSSKIGRTFVFERYDETRPSTSKFVRTATHYGWFRALLHRFHGTFAQILCAGFFINIISLLAPLMLILIYDRVIATGSVEALPMLIAGMVIAAIFEFSLRGVRTHGLAWIAARMDNIVGNRIFSHLIDLPPAMIERASVSSQIARIKTFESIRDFFCSSVFLSIVELPFVFLSALTIYLIAGPLVIVPLCSILIYAALFYFIYKQVRKSIHVAAKVSTARQQFTIESFEKIRGIRAYGLKDIWHDKFRDLCGREMNAHFRLNFLGVLGETLAHAFTIISVILTIAYGVHLIWAESISTGALVATMILVWRIVTPFYSLCTTIPRMEQIRNSIIQVNTLMDIETEQQSSRSYATIPSPRGELSFSDISMKYADSVNTVLSEFSFTALAGDFVGITGENGSGKSSILKLTKGLYTPTAGSIRIDGFDIRQLHIPALRKQIAYVPQHPDYFRGTIIENLRHCNPVATKNDIETALDIADALEDVERLPEGLNSEITRYSDQELSENFLLKMSLARLYLHVSPIMLIDEIPNIILSGRAGKNLRDYIARCKGKRTCLMVTYREDFLKMADTLVLLRRNAAPSVGNMESLIGKVLEAA